MVTISGSVKFQGGVTHARKPDPVKYNKNVEITWASSPSY
jgi:hypothetical protein